MIGWLALPAFALAAVLGVYFFAAAALWAHARNVAPPATLPRALLLGLWLPACGCTATALARRTPARLRAPLLVAAYAANALLVAAAYVVAGEVAALLVIALALGVAAASALFPAPTAAPRTRLADLLLRRDGAPARDAVDYARSYGLVAALVGAGLGASTLVGPRVIGALALVGLALLMAPPIGELETDHGAGFARGVWGAHAAFALGCGAVAMVA